MKMAEICDKEQPLIQRGNFITDDYYQTFFKTLSQLRQDSSFCDVQLQVGKETFNAHKVILMAGSAYFRAMFATEMREHDKDVVKIGGVTAEIFQVLLEFIYSGKVNVTEDNCEDLLRAADMLSVTGVVNVCCSFLKEKFQADNCIAAIDWILHDIPARKKHVFDVMKPIRFPIIPEKQMEKYLTTLQDTDISLHVALTKIVADFKIDHKKSYLEKKHVSKFKHTLMVPRKCARKNIYVVGGFTRPKGGRWSDAKTLSTVERYDTFYHTWHDIPSCQFPRSSLGAGVINGQVCVVGGENDSLIFDSVETYDPVTHEWSLLPGMTTPRCGLGVCTMDNCLFAFGGWVGSEIGKTVEKYDPEIGSWSVVGFCRRLKCWMGVVADKGLIYVVGGSSDLGEELRTVDSYNPVTKEWITLPNMIVRRAYPGVVILDDYLYAVGGWNDDEGALSSVERLSLTAGHWTEISPMSCARAAASVCVVNGMLYVLGGRSYKDEFTAPATLDSMEYYDPSTDRWIDAGCMPTSRCEGAAVVI